MIIENGINPNYSEATIRVDIRGQDRGKVEELIEKLRFEMTYDSITESLKKHVEDWDDQVKKKEFEMSDGYAEVKNIFGTEVLEITGDAPFNFGDDIEKIIDRYIPKAKREYYG